MAKFTINPNKTRGGLADPKKLKFYATAANSRARFGSDKPVGYGLSVSPPKARPTPSLTAPKKRPTPGISPKARQTYNGSAITSSAPPMARTKAVYATPKTASAVKQPKKGVALASSTPPMPRAKSTKGSPSKGGIGSKIRAAFKANAGNNQRLAKERMLKRSRKG